MIWTTLKIWEDCIMPRVKAANENMAKYLKHPITKLGFAGNMAVSVNWPDDTFTNRRIRDGDVVVVEDEKRAKAEQQPAETTPAESVAIEPPTGGAREQ
jgi:hypothetical protein